LDIKIRSAAKQVTTYLAICCCQFGDIGNENAYISDACMVEY